MPWLSIIMFVVSYLLSKDQGKSDGEALALAGMAGLATYYTIDPAGPTDLFGLGTGTEAGPGTGPTVGVPTTQTATGGTLTTAGSVMGSAISTTGEVLKDWGPTGTALVAGTVTAASSGNLLLWGLGAVALLLLIK